MPQSFPPLTLIEVSFADAIRSLRQMAKALDRPLELVPARWSALRIQVGRLHHAVLGMTAKTHSISTGQTGLTQKNHDVVRKVLSGTLWERT